MSAPHATLGIAAEFAARLRAVDIDVVATGDESNGGAIWRALPQDGHAVARIVAEAHCFQDEHASPEAVPASHPALRLVPFGGGTRLARVRADLAREDTFDRVLFVDLALLTGVIEYEPGDGTLTARAGTPWEELAEVVAAGGHDLTPDATRRGATLGIGSGRSTLGGVLGSSASGPDRLSRGPVRHHVLGAEVATASGTLARSGGRLVKNVTGFDVFRLHIGARGTLGVLTEASLRLMPRAEADAIVVVDGLELEGALVRAEALRRSGLTLRASWVTNVMREGFTLAVHTSGRARQVERDTRALVATLGGRRLDGDDARSLARQLRDTQVAFAPDDNRLAASGAATHDAGPASAHKRANLLGADSHCLVLRLRCVPSVAADVATAARAWCVERQAHVLSSQRIEPHFLAWPGVAEMRFALPIPLGDAVTEAAVSALTERMRAVGATLGAESGPPTLRATFNGAAPACQTLLWENALRAGLDPRGLFAPLSASGAPAPPGTPAALEATHGSVLGTNPRSAVKP